MGVKRLLLICTLAFLFLFSGMIQCFAAPSKIAVEAGYETSAGSIGIKGSAVLGKDSDKKDSASKSQKNKKNDIKKTNSKAKTKDKNKSEESIASIIDFARANALYIALAIALIVLAIMAVLTLGRKRKKDVKTVRYFNNPSEEPEKRGISIGNAQHIGMREDQQDSFAVSDINNKELVKQKGIFAVVADGMGGLSNGKESSNIVVSTMLEDFSSRLNSRSLPEELRESVLLANRRVGEASDLRDRQRSGSTVVAVVLKENQLYWISVGDSRIYLFRKGNAYQINRDHVYGLELYSEALNGTIGMEEAKTHPERKSLTSYIGSQAIEEIDQNIKPFQLLPGDRIILCSDGIYGSVTEQEFKECLSLEPLYAAQELIGRITAKGFSSQDNMTVIVIGYDN